jgi:class 3 adenylate cyclase/tetratricopeptide (TPR) repeat protein
MRCAGCGAGNPAGKKFCSQCGTSLAMRCPKCGGENAPDSRFCGDCGKALPERTRSVTEDQTPGEIGGSPVQGERRHLTVLFCDLVNPTGIAANLDPEEWREIASQYQRAASEAVRRFRGHVAQYLGDGIVVYFGYPLAHENDAELAARAGLTILEEMAKLNRALAHKRKPELRARVGIHTGAVVITEGRGEGEGVFGETPNVAARVQAAAEPDTVLVTADTYRLISGIFVTQDCTAQILKGIEHPVQLYRIVQAGQVRSRLDTVAAMRGLTPFIGREDELRMLINRWEQTRESNGQVMFIYGEAGIGKSRLVQEFRSRVAGPDIDWVSCACAPDSQSTPFYPVAEMIRRVMGLRRDESPAKLIGALERSLEAAGLKVAEAVPLIAAMMNLPALGNYPSSLASPDQQRKQLLATLVEWALGAARAHPLVIVTEDLHWVDPSTLEMIQILIDQCATVPLMLIYTARPEFRAPWKMRAHHGQLTLNRLGLRQVREMVAGVATRKSLASDVVDAVVERSGGVPLFVEELTLAVLDSNRSGAAHEIPATLHDSLMARIDRLGAAKEVAQIGAVIGREFSYKLLRAVYPGSEPELRDALARLVDSELVHVRSIPPEANYVFRHELIRVAGYEALLKSRRRELHLRVARAITEKFPEMAQTHPEVLARHWADAGQAELAKAAWRTAANAARSRSAFKEAAESYRQALAILGTLPQSVERDAQEFRLTSAFAGMLQVTRGYTAPETVEASLRVRALADKAGKLTQLVPQLNGAFAAALVSGDLPAANALADQMLDLARHEGSPLSLGFAHMDQVLIHFYRGNLAEVEEHYAAGSGFFEAPVFRKFAATATSAFGLAGISAWTTGRPETARQRLGRAMIAARDNNSPYELAYAHFLTAWLECWVGRMEQAEKLAAVAVALCGEHGFPFFGALSHFALGLATAHLGRADEGVMLIREGLNSFAAIGTRLGITHYLTWLAEAQALQGATSEALSTVEEALQVNPEELIFRPEALRVRAELRFKEGRSESAQADFREAIELARRIGANGWLLRTSTSFARTLQSRGELAAAGELLAPAYERFTEGLETHDLREARALLNELNSDGLR